jgi:hypothetical protein
MRSLSLNAFGREGAKNCCPLSTDKTCIEVRSDIVDGRLLSKGE